MNWQNAHVLITGGSSGIGLGLAQRFAEAGSQVMVTGRARDKLALAAAELPGVQTFTGDMGLAEDREALAADVREHFPSLDVLINNAGGQRRVGLAEDAAPWPERQAEVDSLLCGPVHLCHLLVPLMVAQPGPSLVVNVTSGGAFVPQVFAPLYSACKAALHSYTVTLRHALAGTDCRVVELIPPAVQTQLAGGAAAGHGAPLDEFCDAVFARLGGDELEIGYGPTAKLPGGGELADAFTASAARFKVPGYRRV